MAHSVFATRDFLIGLLYLGMGAGALWAARSLPAGNGAEMGPGYFPNVIAGALIGFGIVSLALAIFRHSEPVSRPGWRGLAAVSVAVVVFAFGLERIGLPLSMLAMLAVASVGAPGGRLGILALLAMAAFTAFCCLVFVVALGLPMPLVGDWFG